MKRAFLLSYGRVSAVSVVFILLFACETTPKRPIKPIMTPSLADLRQTDFPKLGVSEKDLGVVPTEHFERISDVMEAKNLYEKITRIQLIDSTGRFRHSPRVLMLLVLNGNIIGYCYKLEYGSDKYLYQYYVPTRHVDLSTLLGYTPGYFTLPDVPTAAPLKVMNDKERRVSAEYEFIWDELPLAYIIDDNV